MKVIVLEDKKGFRRTKEVNEFPHIYEMVEFPPITAYFSAESMTTTESTFGKKLSFYPEGDPNTETKGITFWLYKER